MKKLLLIVILFVSVVANAQKGISYQAVILDPAKIEIPGQDISGQPFVNGNVSVKFVILSGTTSQFEEVQQTKTDAYGLVNLTIGSAASTAFNSLTWDANQKSLQVFVSFNNGASYTKVSDQKLTYSPYALFSETAGKFAGTLEIANGGTGATTAVGARANLGLGNVDNTSDASKPISAATQTALNLKANASDVNAGLDLKAPLASPSLTGVPLAPTATAGTSTTQIATTAFVQSAIASNTVSLGSVNTASNSQGATLVGNVIKLSPADVTNSGVVNSAAQTFGGVKTFLDGAFKRQVAANAVVDQSNTTSFNGAGGTYQWQSFTAGLTGNLSSVEWKMGTPTYPYGTASSVTLQLYEGEGLDGVLLATVTGSTPANGSNVFVSFPLTNIKVIAETKYTMYLTTPTVTVGWLDVNVSNSYSRGRGSNDPNWDYIFKTNVKAVTSDPYITATNTGAISAGSFVKSGGTSSQYLMADGSVSSAQNSVDLTSAQTIAGVKTFSSNANFSGTITAGGVTYPNSTGTSGQVLTTNGSGTASWGNASGTANSIWVSNSSFEIPSTPSGGVEAFDGIFNGYYYRFLSLYNTLGGASQTRSYITPPSSWGNGSYTIDVYFLTNIASSGNIKLQLAIQPLTMTGNVTSGNEFPGNNTGGYQFGSTMYTYEVTAAANGTAPFIRPLQKASFTTTLNFQNIDFAAVQLGRYMNQGYSYSDTYSGKVYIVGVKITKN